MLMNVLHFVISIWVPLVCAVIIVAVLPLVTGYMVLMERKVMADMQARLGPMRVGPHGLLQPIADAVKLLIKEDIIPDEADKAIFWFAPLISVTAAMLAVSPIAIGPWFQIAELNVGLLFIVGISALGIFGIVLGGWSSNSHYSLLGALRSAAQLVSYETAAGMAIVGALLLAGTLSTREIIQAQDDYGTWFAFAAPVGFFIYIVASIAETNRAPFDLPEAESELVAGYMTEYSGFRWALYFLAEYVNMVVVASIATTLFLGGWLRPFAGTPAFNFLDYLPTVLMLGVGAYCFYRAPKQPVKVQSLFMVAVGLMMFVVAVVLFAPLIQARREYASRPKTRIARGLLVPVQSRRIRLPVHVAALYVPALPLRSTDAPGLAILDPALDRERNGDWHCPGAAPPLGMGAYPRVWVDDAAYAGCGGVAGLGEREEGQRTRVCGRSVAQALLPVRFSQESARAHSRSHEVVRDKEWPFGFCCN